MSTTEELEHLIDEAAEAMWGPELSSILEKALALAVEQCDESGEYRVRLLMGNNAQMTGDTDTLLTNFAWCLAKYDQDPATFPNEPDQGSDLMWQFKWMVGVLGADPQFSTEQINAVIQDMDQHYRRANLGLSGVVMARFEAAFQNGHLDEAKAAYIQLASLDRDEYSHCDACVRSVTMDYHLKTGEPAQGMKEFNELMEGGFTCGEEPENAMSQALVLLVRAGELEGLAALHMRSYRQARGNADNVGIIANHLAFCAITGNEARGLALAERHLAWLAHDPLSHRSHLNFLSALGLLLEKVMAAGHGGLRVRDSDNATLNPFFGQRSHVLTVAELAPLCWSAADALAAEFDARNANAWHSHQVAQRREMIQESHDLPVSAENLTTLTPRTVTEPRNSEEWRVRALDLAAVGQCDAGLAACGNGIRVSVDSLELAALHNAAISIHAHSTGESHQAAIHEAVALRAAALRAAGDEALAGLTERVSAMLAGPEDSERNEEKLAVIRRELQSMEHHPEARCLLNAELGSILIGRGELDQARTALESMDEAITAWASAPTELPVPLELPEQVHLRAMARHSALMLRLCMDGQDFENALVWIEKNLEIETSLVRRATALGIRSRLHAQNGDFAPALADSEAATDHLMALGAREAVAHTLQLSAAILQDMGRTDEFRARLRLGIQQAQMAESPMIVGLAYTLAQDLVEHQDHEEAIELLDETLGNTAIEIGSHDRGELYELLGTAMANAQEMGGALSAWTMGIDGFAANSEPNRVSQLHLAISSLYQEAGHYGAAVDQAQAAVDTFGSASGTGTVEDDTEPQSIIAAHMRLAESMSLNGDAHTLEAIETASGLAREGKSAIQDAQIQLIRARHLFRSGDIEGAVAQALQASGAFEKIDGAQEQAAWALLQSAHMLEKAKRLDDAVAIYKQVVDALEGAGQSQEIVLHQLADCLESDGRTAEAVAVRAQAEVARQAG